MFQDRVGVGTASGLDIAQQESLVAQQRATVPPLDQQVLRYMIKEDRYIASGIGGYNVMWDLRSMLFESQTAYTNDWDYEKGQADSWDVSQDGTVYTYHLHPGQTWSDGQPITDFAGQTRQTFRNIEATLKQAGGTLGDIVTMTVMIRNQSDGDEFVRIRGEFFKSNFPASMLITAKDFANADLVVEIQSVAVIGDTPK